MQHFRSKHGILSKSIVIRKGCRHEAAEMQKQFCGPLNLIRLIPA